MSIMSDSESDSDSDYNLDADFDEILGIIETIDKTHDIALIGLQRLQHQCAQQIRITIDGTLRDLDEVLDELHANALQEIEQTGESSFGSSLRSILDRGTIEKN